MDTNHLKRLWYQALTTFPQRIELYDELATELVNSWKSGDEEVVQILNRHRVSLASRSDVKLRSDQFTIDDAQFLIARELHFEDWRKFVEHLTERSDENSSAFKFEAAVDAVVEGDVAELKRLLCQNPELVRERSMRMHRATLLHYVAANGVEDHRQTTPRDVVEIAEALLEAGAEVDALAETYLGGAAQTTLCLLVSSCHLAKAGVQSVLVGSLLDGGAAVNGVDDDGLPLMTALAFGYFRAAETLSANGARIDNIVAAAALGELGQVKNYVNDDGTLKSRASLASDPWGAWKVPEGQLEKALIYACMFGQTSVAEFLLQSGADPKVQDGQGETALHWAAHGGHLRTVELLIQRNAPLEIRNNYGGTVLGQTIWSARNAPSPGHADVIETLLWAGADVGAATHQTGMEQIDDLLRRHGAML